MSGILRIERHRAILPRKQTDISWPAIHMPIREQCNRMHRSSCRLNSYWRTKDEYVTLLHVVLRTCTVAVRDLQDVEHSIEVTAETLYEAIATALAALQQDNWVGEIGQGFATVTVLVQQPPVKHEVKMKDFISWLGRQGRSPAEVMLKQKLEKILGKANHART
jgi:hypothetical protein